MEREPSAIPAGPRRPVPARELRLSKMAARWLASCGVGANMISVAGCVFALSAGAIFVVMPSEPRAAAWLWLLAALLVQLRLLANMLDGMVAIEAQSVTKHGELYNELPDRLSDMAVLIGLGYAPGGDVLLGYAAALAAVLTAYVRAAGTAIGAPPVYCGPMAKPHRMHAVTFMAVLCAAVAFLGWNDEAVLGSLGIPALGLLIIALGAALTCLRRVIRIARVIG